MLNKNAFMFDFIIQEVEIDHQMAYYNYQGGHCSHESHDYHKNDYQTNAYQTAVFQTDQIKEDFN